MKREGIAYGPVIGYTALLIAASGALGWVVTGSWYPLAILLVPVIGIAAYRLIGLYSDSIRRVTFMFNAIDNDDFTFRFHEDPSKVDNGMLNAALNRIKEILVRAKVRAEERERYYQLIMEYARTGLITINDAGSVYQANGEALRIFGLPRLTHIQQLELPAPEAIPGTDDDPPGRKAPCVVRDRNGRNGPVAGMFADRTRKTPAARGGRERHQQRAERDADRIVEQADAHPDA